MKTTNETREVDARVKPLIRLGVFIMVAGLLAVPFYAARSSSLPAVKPAQTGLPAGAPAAPGKAQPFAPRSAVLTPPAPMAAAIATYDSGCTTSQTVFQVGETVCVRVSGIPFVSFFPRRLTWSTGSTTVQTTDITTDPQSDFYLMTATSNVAGQTIDNRGSWEVVVTNPFFYYPEARATFTVLDAAHPSADLGVSYNFTSSSVQTGSQAAFGIQLNNYGPNASADVRLTDAVPSGTTLVSFTQLTGPTFTCGTSSGLTTCSLLSLDANDSATFLATYTVNSGTQITNTANVASLTTTDLFSLNDSIDANTDVTPDTGQCTLTPPANIIANNDPGTGGHVIAGANFPQPTPVGSCGAVTVSVTPDQSNNYFFPIGTSLVTFTASTGDSTFFAVTVKDVDNPTISCPADINAFESSPGSGDTAVNFAPTVTDNSGSAENPAGSATVDCGAHPSGSVFPVGTTQVTCFATDAANNSSTSCSFNVIVTAVTSTCVLTTQAPIVVDSDANACGTHVTYTTPTSDGSGSCGTVSCDHPSASFFPSGQTLVTCTSNPDGANTTFTVTVNDTTAPAPNLTPLPTINGNCTATAGVPTPKVIHTPTGDITIIVNEPPTATDNCGGQIAGATDDPRTYQEPGTFVVHWTYTDTSGNTSTQSQTVVVTGDDTSPPTITAPAPVTFNTGPASTSCGVTIPDLDLSLGEAVANDSCSVASVERSGVPAGNVFPVGTTTVTYTATDEAGHTASANQVVTVVDNTLPVLTAGPGPVTLYTGAGATSCGVTVSNLDATLGTATGHDNCAFTVVRLGLPAGNVFPVGPTTITYKIVDASGNESAATATQLVTVVDNTAPIVTAPAAVTLYTGAGATSCGVTVSNLDATLGTGSATDNCPGVGAVTRSGVPAGNVFPVGPTTLTYSATDAHGNTSSANQLVTVVDDTPPQISCQANIIADFNPAVNGAVVTYTAPVGTDNCASTTTQIAGLPSGSTFPTGTTTNTFRVTDASGNTASCSFKVTVAITSIIGMDSVSITGNALVDSYDSTGGYPATKGSLANVLSNGTITISGSSKVFGNVRSTRVGVNLTGTSQVTGNATAGTTVSKAASAIIGGTITNNALAPFMTMPAVPACSPFSSNSGITGTYSYNAATGDLTLSGINIATLANGNYCFHNVTLTNSGQLKVNGPVTIRLTGTLNTSGATSLPNTTLIPSNLRVLSSYSGSNGVVFGNSSSLQLVVYAPNTNVNITGSAPLFGTVVGKTITLSNSGMIHYDTKLKAIWPDVWTLIFGP